MISILNKRAPTHPNWCEDNYWIKETKNLIIGAVLDGCSTGKDSHFASTLFKHLLERIHKTNYDYYERESSLGIIEVYLWELWGVGREGKQLCSLSEMNLLSTVVMFVYNKETLQLTVKFVGDGVVYANGQEFVNDEANQPNYLAYHFEKSFEEAQKFINSRRMETFENVVDFSVCTDGIQSFVNLKNPSLDPKIAVDYLVKDTRWVGMTHGLGKKFNILTNRVDEYKLSDEMCWWEIQDDLTIIRYHDTV